MFATPVCIEFSQESDDLQSMLESDRMGFDNEVVGISLISSAGSFLVVGLVDDVQYVLDVVILKREELGFMISCLSEEEQ